MAKKVITTDQPIVIPGMSIKHSEIFLVSDSPLISHRWSEKSKKEIRGLSPIRKISASFIFIAGNSIG